MSIALLNKTARKALFYVLVTIPAYVLIYMGLLSYGAIPSYYNSYGPSIAYAPYYILIGFAIITATLIHASKGAQQFLALKGGLHTHHCEISSFFTYFGIVAIFGALIMYYMFQLAQLYDMIILFGIALLSGIGAIIYYRYDNSKFPFG